MSCSIRLACLGALVFFSALTHAQIIAAHPKPATLPFRTPMPMAALVKAARSAFPDYLSSRWYEYTIDGAEEACTAKSLMARGLTLIVQADHYTQGDRRCQVRKIIFHPAGQAQPAWEVDASCTEADGKLFDQKQTFITMTKGIYLVNGDGTSDEGGRSYARCPPE